MPPDPLSGRSPIAASPRAFTLVEVLITLLLVGVLLPVIVRATGLSAQLGAWSQRSATAAQLADAQLAELLVTRDWELGPQDGTFDESIHGRDADRYAWALDVEDDGGRRQQLTLTVTWESGGRDRAVSLITLARTPDTAVTTTPTSTGVGP
jgi:prepilin-type N-terminal cleavage/methylation domain-containing protein